MAGWNPNEQQLRGIVGDIMEQIRACDEKVDAEGFCTCARYILGVFRDFLIAKRELESLLCQEIEQVRRTAATTEGGDGEVRDGA